MAGLYYETNDTWRGAYSDFDALGRQVAQAHRASKQRFHLASHRDMKKSDWPAFRASTELSIRQFERNYIRYNVMGAEHWVSIESQAIASDIELRSSAHTGNPLDLGDKICRMHRYFLRWESAMPTDSAALDERRVT